MKIIDRIEIHRFRSIGDESIPAADVNVYSGVNNSGKSNILRGLNLFFNQETSYDSPFNFGKDYNKAYTGQAGGAREIRITVHFNPHGKAALQYPFSITRSFRLGQAGFETEYHSVDTEIQTLIIADNGNITAQFTRFLNSIKYFYIPAVRDKRFVRHLFLNFEQIVTDKKDGGLEDKLRDLSDVIGTRSEAISRDFEQFLKLPTKATISSELSDILGSIQVNVDSGLQVLKKSKQEGRVSEITPVFVELFSSGDGVLMSYLAYFLAHLCRETPRVRYVWGFEEPENSLEYSKVQRLADEFINKFSTYAQIFLTTHSPAFVNLRNEKNVNFYRVYIEPTDDPNKPDKRLTRIRTLDAIEKIQLSLLGDKERTTELELLRQELGMVEFSQEIERAARELQGAMAKHEAIAEGLTTELEGLKDTYPERILIIEDSKTETLTLWSGLIEKAGIQNVKILSSEGCTTNKIEEHLLQLRKNRTSYSPKVFREIDRDGLTDVQVSYVESQLNNIVANKFPYTLVALPVNELENFAIIDQDLTGVQRDYEEELREKFENTARAKLGQLHRTYPKAPSNTFRHNNDDMPVIQNMRSTAVTDWNRLMPGKDITKKIDGFRPIDKISSFTLSTMPIELKQYLDKMKDFFGGDNDD